MEFAVRRADSGWSAMLVSASAADAPGSPTPARVDRVACPSADAEVGGNRG
jgi:hypothetical protein